MAMTYPQMIVTGDYCKHKINLSVHHEKQRTFFRLYQAKNKIARFIRHRQHSVKHTIGLLRQQTTYLMVILYIQPNP